MSTPKLIATLTAIAAISIALIKIDYPQKNSLDEFNSTMIALLKNPANADSVSDIKGLQEAYNNDTHSNEPFDAYKVAVYDGPLAMLDLNTSSSGPRMFRTVINDQLKTSGINFAGKYTLVEIPMTAWTGNYVIVDRTNGKASVLPYEMLGIDTRADSTLLRVNPKSHFNTSCLDPKNETGCVSPDELDMRPYYYVWNGVTLLQLGNPAPKTKFWEQWELE